MASGWKDIAANVAAFAPGIGAALGGVPGSIVGLGVQKICSFFGIKPDEKDAAQKVESALNMMTPAQAIEFKQADDTFKLEMEKLGVNLEEIAAKDRDSARKMQIETRSYAPPVLALLVTVGFFVLIGVMMSYEMPAGNKSVLILLIGSLGTVWGMIANYYFGSSAGSKVKTDRLAEALRDANGK